MHDKQGVVGNQLFTSLLRRGGGWFANHAPQCQRVPTGFDYFSTSVFGFGTMR